MGNKDFWLKMANWHSQKGWVWWNIFKWFLEDVAEHIVEDLIQGIQNESSFNFIDVAFAGEATQVREVNIASTETSEDLD